MAKLRRKFMADATTPISEGEELDAVLDNLERQSQVTDFTGWDSGFANLNRALDGLRPGLHLIIGPPACGKSSLARQLADQVAEKARQPAIFFSCTDSLDELRIKTLARLSGIENKEIRRGASYLLHWYGVPKAHHAQASELQPSWEKLRRRAEEAKDWLERVYLVQCDRGMKLEEIAERSQAIGTPPLIVIDDGHILSDPSANLAERLRQYAEELQHLAGKLRIPIIATWPDLGAASEAKPELWAAKVAAPSVIMVLEPDPARTAQLTEPNQAFNLYIVRNRAGERAKLRFEFEPAFARFTDVS